MLSPVGSVCGLAREEVCRSQDGGLVKRVEREEIEVAGDEEVGLCGESQFQKDVVPSIATNPNLLRRIERLHVANELFESSHSARSLDVTIELFSAKDLTKFVTHFGGRADCSLFEGLRQSSPWSEPRNSSALMTTFVSTTTNKLGFAIEGCFKLL